MSGKLDYDKAREKVADRLEKYGDIRDGGKKPRSRSEALERAGEIARRTEKKNQEKGQ